MSVTFLTNEDEKQYVKSINGVKPDPETGDVPITIPESGGNADYVGVEPAEEDIPKIFFGGALQQTKEEVVVPFRYISKTEEIIGFAEIKAQGNSSMSYPKKNQTVKLFKDAYCTEKLKADFKGWGKQNKFCFKANWIDLTHARNVVSARLWADVLRSREEYESLPELLRTSPNQGAVDGFPVKVYAAGVYQGRYTLNIPKDKWMANMDDALTEHCILCGEGGDSALFRATAKIDGSDWSDEIHDNVPAAIKQRWNEIINFVMTSTDAEFKANLGNYFYVDSLIDYHLFGLASCGFDAYCKNQIFMTYDGQKWLASMYDMDSTWGLYFTGDKFLTADHEFDGIKDGGHLLFLRLEDNFADELKSRWAELKSGALSIENIINRFERFTDIAPPHLVEEDYAETTANGAYTAIPSKTTNNIQQIRAFALARQVWTDEYVTGLTPTIPVPCTGISLNKSTLTITGEGSQTLIATVTPDGCTDPVTWESNNTSVATVNAGVVTAIANGSATITAKCGNYSTSCSVAVSGISESVACTGITLDKNELTFDGEGTQTVMANVTPADTTDSVVWVSSNPAVALITVEGNVCTVQSKKNGSAVITASCGEYSASCTVSVSGIVVSNLLNGATWVTGSFTNGEIATSGSDKVCETYIPVSEKTAYVLGNINGGGFKWFNIQCYDSSKAYTTAFENEMAYASLNKIFVTPAGCAYVRVLVAGSYDTATQAALYALEDISVTNLLAGFTAWSDGEYAFDASTGEPIGGAMHIAEEFIPITAGHAYALVDTKAEHTWLVACTYANDHSFITRNLNAYTDAGLITAGNTAVYIKPAVNTPATDESLSHVMLIDLTDFSLD